MSTIKFREKKYHCQPQETVLECLLREGVEAPSSCRSGVCQTCMMRAVEGLPPTEAQQGIKDTLQAQGYFLACICKATDDMTVVLADEESQSFIPVEVVEKTRLADEIIRLRLRPEKALAYHAGQFVNLRRQDGLVRSYSLASLPQSGELLELHVRVLPEGKMSQWIEDNLVVGQQLELEGAHGNCFYTAGEKLNQPLLLIGTGTGLAPLWGILRDALAEGHSGPIHLFHGSYTVQGLYLVNDLKAIAAEHDNVTYYPCADVADEGDGVMVGRVHELALQAIPDLQGWRIFLCGHPAMVEGMKRSAFLAGASLSDIYADPFVYSSGDKN